MTDRQSLRKGLWPPDTHTNLSIHTQREKKVRKERRGSRSNKEKKEDERPSGLERWLSR